MQVFDSIDEKRPANPSRSAIVFQHQKCSSSTNKSISTLLRALERSRAGYAGHSRRHTTKGDLQLRGLRARTS